MGVGEEKKRQAPTMKSHDSKTVFELINTLYKSEAKLRQTTERVIWAVLHSQDCKTKLWPISAAEEQQEENSSTWLGALICNRQALQPRSPG